MAYYNLHGAFQHFYRRFCMADVELFRALNKHLHKLCNLIFYAVRPLIQNVWGAPYAYFRHGKICSTVVEGGHFENHIWNKLFCALFIIACFTNSKRI